MPKTNFSKEEIKVYDLTMDLMRGDFSRHIDEKKLSCNDLENYLRDKIQDDILKGRTLYQAFRRNNLVMFEIIEEIVNVAIGEDVLNSPFIEAFVDYKNRGLGDRTDFYSEGGLFVTSTFAGNHWDTNRQSMDLGDVITLPKEWCYIHLYEDLERFLLKIISLDKLMDRIYKSVNKFFKDRMYLQFQNVENAVPADFAKNGNSEEAVGELVDLVQAAGGYSSITIAGTKGALRKLAGIIPEKMFPESMKEAKAQTGALAEWEGNKLMVIPQTLKSGTFDLALDNSKLFIMGGDVDTKPIKFEFYGDTRSEIETTGHKNNDMSCDIQIQTKFGMGLVLPPYFGVFTFA